MSASPSPPLVSVVIIGRNEGARLERCLESVSRLSGLNGAIEVIYADSHSNDGSADRARTFGAAVIEVHPSFPTAAVGRNAGWRAARAPLILFLDGDTIVHPDFVSTALRQMQDAGVAIVWGHRREINTGESLYNRALDLDWVYRSGVTEFCGGDALMRRSALEECGGYDETLIAGEEPEMCRRIRAAGHLIVHIDAPMTGHDLAMTRFAQYWKRALRAGYAYAQVSQRFRGTGDPFWEPDRRRNVHRGLFWLCLAPVTLVLCGMVQSGWPVLGAIAMIAALILRSAWTARWKGGNAFTLLLYGLHSHFQQVPILLGQWQFSLDQRRGLRRGLIEYKEAR